MSIIIGCVHKEAFVDTAAELQNMYREISHYPHTEYRSIVIGSAAFGILQTLNTPEAQFETHPIYLEDKKLMFVGSGRLDNRPELAESLGLKILEKIPDGELMLRSYLKWGKDCSTHLRGKWTIAAYHSDSSDFFLSRDHHDYTALNYSCNEQLIVFSNVSKALFAHSKIQKSINKKFMLESLVGSIGNGVDSPFERVSRLPAAHALLGRSFKLKSERFWFPENVSELRLHAQREYAEAFKELLDLSITSRMRSAGPIATTLSAGLDSSSVSVLAAEQLAKRNLKLSSYTHVPQFKAGIEIDKYRTTNEQPLVEELVSTIANIDPHYVASESLSVINGMELGARILNTPLVAAGNAYWLLDITSLAAASGNSVLLTGELGNANLSFAGIRYLLSSMQLKQFWGYRNAFKLKLVRPCYAKVSKYIKSKIVPIRHSLNFDSYLAPAHLINMELRDLLIKEPWLLNSPRQYSSTKSLICDVIQLGKHQRGYFGSLIGDYYGLEWRDPLSDFRLIEFALSMPNESFFNTDGSSKYLVKEIMQGRLPAAILHSEKKGLQSSDLHIKLLNSGNQLSLLINELSEDPINQEYVNFKKLRKTLSTISDMPISMHSIIKLQHMLRALGIAQFVAMQNSASAN